MRQTKSSATAKKFSKFIFSITPSLCLTCSSSPPDILPLPSTLSLILCFSFLSLSLSLSHAVHTALSQSVQWTRAQTVDWDITCSLERWSGWRRKRESEKRLSNVQFHLNQSSEADSRSALGYVLNPKAKEETATQREETDKLRESLQQSLCCLAKQLQNRWLLGVLPLQPDFKFLVAPFF